MAKPAEDPKDPALELAIPTPALEQSEAPKDPAIHIQSHFPELSADETILDPSTIGPSSSANPPEPSNNDVLITGSRFVEPGNPTVLARHSAKQEALER